MMRSCLVAVMTALVLGAPVARGAFDYTDSWWTPAEPGWGVNLTQQAGFVYATFFVYALDGKATFFAANMARDGASDRFTGPLYRTTGTWFGAPAWSGYTYAQAGTATFTATSSTTGTLAYDVDGVSVSKSIQRFTLVPLSVTGLYVGGLSGRRTGCERSGAIVETMQFDVLHSAVDNRIRIDQLPTRNGQVVCRMEGIAAQTGKLLTVDNASYSCTDGWDRPARIFNLRPTPAGFEGQWFSDAGNGCSESGQFSGVSQFP